MDLGLKGKVVMVAGASRGLGYAIAKCLSAEGASVSIASSDQEAITKAGNTFSGALAMRCDMRSQVDIDAWVAATLERFGRIDGVLMNGGGPPPGSFDNFDDDAWQAAFELTLLSAVRLVRAALPSLRENKGAVLFLTSSSVKEPVDFLLFSNVMRSGVASLSKSLSRTLGKEGVRFNCIMPGSIETDRIKALVANQAKANGVAEAQQRQNMESLIPMGRFGEPEEFARAAAFLLSPAASYINGETLTVDGGAMKTLF